MATQLQKLFFSIDLLDKITGPIGKIQKKMNRFTSGVTDSFQRIGAGGLGVAGAGLAMEQLVQPAIDVHRAMGEVKSLGVQQDALNKLADTAVDFQMQFGGAAAGFISSAYDIQSAISGLSGNELSRFTNASAVLAKGTKSDTATITAYMGTMYGIFKNSADAMGKAQWVEQLTGQTATAVQMFKTTGTKMSDAFGALGADATTAGRSAAEQMAILGTLQATMEGSEAGTKYRAFLNGAGAAQKELGLSFTDSRGRMLGMVDILGKLRGKFGDTMDVAESDALKKAFGSDEAAGMIKLLLQDTTGLAKSIEALGNVSGMDQATQMANDMTDTWQRLGGVMQGIRIIFAQALLPVIEPWVTKMGEGGKVLSKWMKMFPALTQFIGKGALVIIGFGAALGALAMGAGIVNILAIGVGVLGTVLGALIPVIMSVGIALLTTPLGWTIMLIAALAFGVWKLISHWDQLKTAIMDSAPFQAVAGFINDVIAGWENLKGVILNFDWLEWLGQKFDWLTEKLSWLPGGVDAEAAPAPPSLSAPRQLDIPPGGLTRQISQSINNNRSSNSQRSIGSLTINTSQPMTPAQLDEMVAMAAW